MVTEVSASASINSVSLSPLGGALAVASSDGKLYLYSLPTPAVPVTPVKTPAPTPPIVDPPGADGILSFSSAPSGATVYVNNAVVGITPPVTLPPLKAGQYPVLIRLDGYNDWTTTINLLPGDTVNVVAQMTAATPVSTPPVPPAGFLPVLAGLILGAVLVLRRSDD